MGKRRGDVRRPAASPFAPNIVTGGFTCILIESFAQPGPVLEADIVSLAFDSEMAAATAAIARATADDNDGAILARIIARAVVAPTVILKLNRDGATGFLALFHVLLRDHWSHMQMRLLSSAGTSYLHIIGVLQQTICPRELPDVVLADDPDPDQLYMLVALEGVRCVHQRLPEGYLQKTDFSRLLDSRWMLDLFGLFLYQLPNPQQTQQLMTVLVSLSSDQATAVAESTKLDARVLVAWRSATQRVFTGQGPPESSNIVIHAYEMACPEVRQRIFDADAEVDDGITDAAITLGAAANWLRIFAPQRDSPDIAQFTALHSRLALDAVMALRDCLDRPVLILKGDAICTASLAIGLLSGILIDFFHEDAAKPVLQFHATLFQMHWKSPITRAPSRAMEAELRLCAPCLQDSDQRRIAFGRLARAVCAAALVEDKQIREDIITFIDSHLVPFFLVNSKEEATRRLVEFNTAVLVRALADGRATILPVLASNLSYFSEFAMCKLPPKPLAPGFICAVCLEDESRQLILTPCGHIFHCDCLARTVATATFDEEIIQVRCPCCRSGMSAIAI